jgi:hypothetical protein
VTIKVAPKTPKLTQRKPSLGFIPKRVLAKAPVQAPVMGRGIATKIANPNLPHLAYSPENAFSVLLNHQSKNLLKKEKLADKYFCPYFKKYIKGNIGNKLPNIDKIMVLKYPNLKTNKPKGIAPRNSKIGTMAVKRTFNSLDILFN